ncbi:MAG: hypothetical protein E7012_04985 [Alphaproteobacteria bacterium]|nr:hypothetical protein [Alphaproteobacteria bacterium]
MMQTKTNKGSDFLSRINAPNVNKEDVFRILFDARGVGEDINTKHIFFQEVIIKFNASKAIAVIKNHLPYETDSHYVDVAIFRYMQLGGNIKEFDADLKKFKIEYCKTHSFISPQMSEQCSSLLM